MRDGLLNELCERGQGCDFGDEVEGQVFEFAEADAGFAHIELFAGGEVALLEPVGERWVGVDGGEVRGDMYCFWEARAMYMTGWPL